MQLPAPGGTHPHILTTSLLPSLCSWLNCFHLTQAETVARWWWQLSSGLLTQCLTAAREWGRSSGPHLLFLLAFSSKSLLCCPVFKQSSRASWKKEAGKSPDLLPEMGENPSLLILREQGFSTHFLLFQVICLCSSQGWPQRYFLICLLLPQPAVFLPSCTHSLPPLACHQWGGLFRRSRDPAHRRGRLSTESLAAVAFLWRGHNATIWRCLSSYVQQHFSLTFRAICSKENKPPSQLWRCGSRAALHRSS